ncbi:MAG: SUMF1/EgtB/PvdO family nonheme iron enzyme [Gammaproteobacteria bacterium]|nr:SUMF1/EgtB/PvdO family nonheme iron enzyme [Gammaproteobacteria bacterium]
MHGTNRVIRGGNWNNNSSNARCANRNNNTPTNRNNNIGFRCASTHRPETGAPRGAGQRVGSPDPFPLALVEGQAKKRRRDRAGSLAAAGHGTTVRSRTPASIPMREGIMPRWFILLLALFAVAAQAGVHSQTSTPFTLITGSFPSTSSATAAPFVLNTFDIATSTLASDISNAFPLDTRYESAGGGGELLAVLDGFVEDGVSRAPIPWATLLLQPLGRVITSNAAGYFSLSVGAGIDYLLRGWANGYQPASLGGVNLVAGQTTTVALELEPLQGQVAVVEIAPSINPSVSSVEQGGDAVRHYRVLRNGQPAPGASVSVSGSAGGFSATSDAEGVVRITVPHWRIGSSLPGATGSFSITQVDGVDLDDPVTFVASVRGRERTRTWRNDQFRKLGLSFVRAQITNGAEITVTDDGTVMTGPDEVEILREARRSVGVEFSVGASAGVNLGSVQLGAGAEAGIGGNIAAITEDGYVFPLQDPTGVQVIAQYILVADGILGDSDQGMVRLLGHLVDIFPGQNSIDEASIYTGKGIGVKCGAEAHAMASAGSRQQRVGGFLGASVEGEANLEGRQRSFSHEAMVQASVAINGALSGSASAGLYFGQPAWRRSEMLDFPAMLGLDASLEGSLGGEFTLQWSNNVLTRMDLDLRRRWAALSSFGQSGSEVELKYILEGSSPDVSLVVGMTSLARSALYNARTAVSNASLSNDILFMLDQVGTMQQNQAGTIGLRYERRREVVDHVSQFEIGVEGELTSVLSIQVGVGEGFEESHGALMERGVVHAWRHYPTESYPSTFYSVGFSFPQYLQGLSNQLPWYARAGLAAWSFVDWITPWRTECYPIGTRGTCVEIAQSHVPDSLSQLSVAEWSWYGGSASVLATHRPAGKRARLDALRQQREEQLGLHYGIGGFYQFEPLGISLPADSCFFTIAYSDSECVGIDESELALFMEDKANQDWIYLGGAVDTQANTVRASIPQLGCFTLAPRLSRGWIPIGATPATLPADSSSVTQLSIGPVLNNDGSVVADGRLVTVACDRGQIVSPDEDPDREGVQVVLSGGMATAQLLSGRVPFVATVTVSAVTGTAQGTLEVPFTNVDLPDAPVLLALEPVHKALQVRWEGVTNPDLGGYKVWFDDDTLAPHDGQASVWGTNSPVSVGDVTEHSLTGLTNGAHYWVAVSAVDVAGAEGPLSNWLSATPALPPLDDVAIINTGTGLRLSWSTAPGAYRYTVWQGDCGAPFTAWTVVGTTTTTIYDLPIQDDAARCFRVVVSAW